MAFGLVASLLLPPLQSNLSITDSSKSIDVVSSEWWTKCQQILQINLLYGDSPVHAGHNSFCCTGMLYCLLSPSQLVQSKILNLRPRKVKMHYYYYYYGWRENVFIINNWSINARLLTCSRYFHIWFCGKRKVILRCWQSKERGGGGRWW